MLQTSATKVSLDRFAPDSAAFVKMHFWGITLLQSVDSLSKLFTKALIFDFPDWIQICLEGENQSLRLWKPMQSLALIPKKGLLREN
jgi:hypothetical protein